LAKTFPTEDLPTPIMPTITIFLLDFFGIRKKTLRLGD